MKRTPWFSCKTPPVRVGVYETAINGFETMKRRWDGQTWRYVKSDIPCFSFGKDELWDDQWRGLTEQAK